MLKAVCIAFLCFLTSTLTRAQTSNTKILPWEAKWIVVPHESPTDYGVYLFRKSIDFSNKPASFIIHVSADNRYKLYINQQLVSTGPARGDIFYWNYETIDIAPFLKPGKNTVAAQVWNEGNYRQEAQVSLRTGFILQAGNKNDSTLNTNKSWKCLRDNSRQPLPGIGYADAYYVAGPGEIADMSKSVKNWQATSFDDSKWLDAEQIDNGNPKGAVNAWGWMLVPSPLPQMERTLQRIPVVRQADGVKLPVNFPAQKQAVNIPAHTTATLLLDQTFVTNALVSLNLSRGKNATVSLGYAEALFSYKNQHRYKSNRNETAGKVFLGRKDSIICDGSAQQQFTTLGWRTFRYIQVRIKTADEPLVINDLYGTFTGYPFQLKAKLETSNNNIQQILNIGWRTARLCAAETYMDCPYYEQLQYVGDSRIQAMISYYNSGDDRLARNAINQIDHSRLGEGVTLSRYPSSSPQVISTFSLWYIGMIHDYWMYRPDTVFIRQKLASVRDVLNFFGRYQQTNGLLKQTPYWTFTDWVEAKGWDFGAAPFGKSGHSAILDLQLLMAYQEASAMETKLGSPEFANIYAVKAAQLKAAIRLAYWDSSKNLFADTDDKNAYSQHINSLAMLANAADETTRQNICSQLINNKNLTPATIYYKYYVHQALVKGGFGNQYINWLDQWRNNIKAGLTTWAETSDLENTRSDCHAWGASPNIEFYRTLLGIDTDAPGFNKVKIEPQLGNLLKASGEIPHPKGTVKVSYQFNRNKWFINIDLPQNLSGRFIWKGKTYNLAEGKNNLII